MADLQLHQEAEKPLKKILYVFLSVIITFTSYPILTLLTAIFVTYRSIVDVILRVKIGKNYGGLLNSSDAIFYREDISKAHVVTTLIIKTNKRRDIFKDFAGIIEERLFRNPDLYPKLTGTIGIFGGYPYIIKNSCNWKNCLKALDVPEGVVFDEDYLKVQIGLLTNTPLPQNDSTLWEYTCSQRSLDRKDDDGFYYYPFIIRTHHALADGVTLIAFLIKTFNDEDTENYGTELLEKMFNPKLKQMTPLENIKYKLNKIKAALLDILFIFFMGIGRIVLFETQPADENGLHGPVLTGEKLVAWSAEDNEKFVPLVKEIKRRFDCSFTYVILTALSASLTNFFKRKSLPVPECLSTFLPLILELPKIHGSKIIPLKNHIAAIYLDIPTHSTHSITETLQKVSRKCNQVNVADVKTGSLIMKYFGILPRYLLSILNTFSRQTCAITNVPGGGRMALRRGYDLEKIIPMSPNTTKIVRIVSKKLKEIYNSIRNGVDNMMDLQKTVMLSETKRLTEASRGVTLTVLTYDNRFQLSIMVDKAIIQSQEEAQRIVDDIYYYLALLDEESRKLAKNCDRSVL